MEGEDTRPGSPSIEGTVAAGVPAGAAGGDTNGEIAETPPDYEGSDYVMEPGGIIHRSLNTVAKRNRYILSDASEQTIEREIEARQKLVTPLILALGWNIYAPEVRAEARPRGMDDRADYLLCDREGNAAVVVEAKRPGGITEKATTQTIKYARLSGADYGLLTDGEQVRLWEVASRAPPNEIRRLHGTVDDLADNEYVAAITRQAVRGMSADIPQWTARAALTTAAKDAEQDTGYSDRRNPWADYKREL